MCPTIEDIAPFYCLILLIPEGWAGLTVRATKQLLRAGATTKVCRIFPVTPLTCVCEICRIFSEHSIICFSAAGSTSSMSRLFKTIYILKVTQLSKKTVIVTACRRTPKPRVLQPRELSILQPWQSTFYTWCSQVNSILRVVVTGAVLLTFLQYSQSLQKSA